MLELGKPVPISEWEVDGLRIKTTQGTKLDRHADDRKIWVAGPSGRFNLLSSPALGAVVVMFHRNEELLYPSAATGGFRRGGEMVMDNLRDCLDYGIVEAAKRNELQPPEILGYKGVPSP